MSKTTKRLAPATIAAQADHQIGYGSGGVVPAIELSSTFARDHNYDLIGPTDYARSSHPNAVVAEGVLAKISGGADAILFNAGMTAITTVFETLRSGQHVVAPQIMYHGTGSWLRRLGETRAVETTFFDACEQGALSAAVRPGQTSLIWIETPTNPTWDVIDIAGAAKAAHTVGAKLVVDCTVAPPCTTDAFALGADLVFHSATKYLGGHSDLTAGALVVREADGWWDEMRRVRTLTGGIITPFDAWLLTRGMRTLYLRFERASANALAIAQHFEGHPKVERVLYPGLPSHPGHEVAKRQMTGGFGGMMSLLVRGDETQSRRMAGAVEVFIPATSLGGVESLIEHRKTVEGPQSPVPPNLLRLSVGIEAVEDLIADLEQALATLG
ncbi:MAG: PLP-dependent transferase [Hyphomicrobiaceae bacterium]|nr:PLP-dependent transferase [Hyphomicrobiaceae bacterium]